MPVSLEERKNAFTYKKPSVECQKVMSRMCTEFQEFTEMMHSTLTESRETSLAFTALEECAMWAMKSLSHYDPDGETVSP